MRTVAESVEEPQPRELTTEEGRALLDARARAELGMSGEEFRRAYAADELGVDDDAVLSVSMLLPLGR